MPFWFFLYAYAFVHPMGPVHPMVNKGFIPPPAIIAPAPPPTFVCQIIKYPTKTDPTTIKACPQAEHDVRVDY